MSKKFTVNGCELICVNEQNFEDVCDMFKENITIDNMENWESKKEMEQYTAMNFISEARHYLSLSPPDLVQSAEKIWFAAVFAVKELFLSCGGIDLKSHNALKYFCRFALHHAALPWKRFDSLFDCWAKAEKMHRDVYGSGNFRSSEYAQTISDVETFVLEFAKFDRKKIWAEFDKVFIAGIDPDVEIKKESHTVSLGYVLIYNVDLSILSFKNLKIIWGDELLDENTRDGALTISNNHNLKEVLMPNLRTVEKGNVNIENNTFLCYLRDKVLWNEILNYEEQRLFARPNGFRQCDHSKLANNIKCSSSCEKDHCWSRDSTQCQKLYRTVCPEKCHLSKQCYRVGNTDEYDCCHATCAGGCTGPTAQDCLACKENSYNGVCVSKCPELMVYDRRTATRIPNPYGTYLYDRYCVDKCPDHLLIDGETCVRHCSVGKHHDMTKETRECEKCKGECPKVCYVDHPLTGSILRNLVDCEEIDGFIAILDSKMSSSDGYSVEDLYALKSVRMISEYIVISTVHISPRNLSFLENLEFVEGRQLSNRRYALEITKNDLLSSLDLKSLKTIKNGHVIIAENVGLCYVDSIDWSVILANNSVAKISENQFSEQCRLFHMTMYQALPLQDRKGERRRDKEKDKVKSNNENVELIRI